MTKKLLNLEEIGKLTSLSKKEQELVEFEQYYFETPTDDLVRYFEKQEDGEYIVRECLISELPT